MDQHTEDGGCEICSGIRVCRIQLNHPEGVVAKAAVQRWTVREVLTPRPRWEECSSSMTEVWLSIQSFPAVAMMRILAFISSPKMAFCFLQQGYLINFFPLPGMIDLFSFYLNSTQH